MQINLTPKEFRRLLDLVYIGNWVLNSTRGEDRFADYDNLESKLFALSPPCPSIGTAPSFPPAPIRRAGFTRPSPATRTMFFTRFWQRSFPARDMDYPEITDDNYDEIVTRMDRYMSEFELSGVDHLVLDEENA